MGQFAAMPLPAPQLAGSARLARRQVPGLLAVAFAGGGTGIEHDVGRKAGFVGLAYDGAARATAQDRPAAQPPLLASAGEGASQSRP
jgi:hypothetical protein